MAIARHLIVINALAMFCAGPLAAEQVSGAQVAERTTRVAQKIEWSRDLEALKQRAQKEKKLVYWLQLVGDLNGGL